MTFEEIDHKIKQFRYLQHMHDYEGAENIRRELLKAGIVPTAKIFGTGWRKV